ncbi:MAG: DUF2442 domain-containing protein [Desulfobacterales bacterium]|nr:DUF2442 domain-containing protein [Desulfobacterales bacterium]
MIEVNKVEVGADYRLHLIFENGESRVFDMTPYLQYPVFQRLRNSGFFSLARVDYGTVTWPGGIDIAPETLYEFSGAEKEIGDRQIMQLSEP